MIEKITPETLPDVSQFDDVPERSELFWEDDGFDPAENQNLSEDEIQRNFVCAAEESLAHYKATGLHITHEELNAWLDTWGTPNALPMPECHT
jgi:hypothetical protein